MLASGTKLGPYEVVSPLGAGGMGEVYRARDTRLERTVAVKVLNSSLAGSPELKARFEREAKIISQLQHPNICVLHDVGSEDGTDFLVMEYLEGESLAERLKKGPLAAEELLKATTLQAVDVRTIGSALELGIPHTLFKASMVSGPQGPFAVSADGKKILLNQLGEAKVLAPLTLVTNWTADLKK